MTLRINDIAPDFTAETPHGPMHFHVWMGDDWAVLLSHPKDFTPVCTTERGAVAGLASAFAARGAKIIGFSVDPVASHRQWAQDIQDVSGHTVHYHAIAHGTCRDAQAARQSCGGKRPPDRGHLRAVAWR